MLRWPRQTCCDGAMDCIAREMVDRGYVAIEDGNVAMGGRLSCIAMVNTNVAAGDQVGGWECWKGRPSGVAMADESAVRETELRCNVR